MTQARTGGTDELRPTLIEVYNLYRTALLNRKYYARRLAGWRWWNMVCEVAIALGTSGTIATWAVWKTGLGEYAWTFVAAFTAILAVLKPIIQLTKGIERYSKLYIGHSDLFYDLQGMVAEIQRTHNFSAEMISAIKSARGRFKKLALDDDPTPNPPQVRECYNEVNREIPPESLWVPN